ncbi:DUF2953 domain-containing protein [Cohnella sp. CFH 77786]|uniref:DUF2953 domain-containing protein n=1 Tax=Cohnella sp. CFH 77786 TaxID=2662265 RepID=UPI001C60B7D7|nr:DUF2953 domain-containing protein [Cohnella sp. CFH 77786]MBW5446689.1 DUF2953 domain-containing protein [Cohnella sp. CFH 77786]
MAFWLWIGLAALAVLVALTLLLAFSRIRIRIRYSRSGESDQLTVIVRALYGAYRYRAIVPSIMFLGANILFDKKSLERVVGRPRMSMSKWRVAADVLKLWREISPWLRDMIRNVNCTRFRFDFRVGTGEASSTAILSGLLWSVYGWAIGIVGQWVNLKTKPYGAIEPVYHAEEFSMVWEADFEVRAGAFAMSVLHLGFRHPGLRQSWRKWRGWLRGPQSA